MGRRTRMRSLASKTRLEQATPARRRQSPKRPDLYKATATTSRTCDQIAPQAQVPSWRAAHAGVACRRCPQERGICIPGVRVTPRVPMPTENLRDESFKLSDKRGGVGGNVRRLRRRAPAPRLGLEAKDPGRRARRATWKCLFLRGIWWAV